MFWNLAKAALLAISMVLIAIMFGGVTSTSANAPQLAPPTVVLPTPAVTRTPSRVTPAAPAAPLRVVPTATKVAASVMQRANPRFAFPSYTTSINLLNLGGDTTVTLTYYNQDGSAPAGSPFSEALAANASKVYFPIPGVSSGFNGSTIISSGSPLGSIVNVVGVGGTPALDSYVGATSGSTSVQLPLLMSNNNGIYTWFDVQNVGSVAATVNIAYSDGTTASQTIQPGASKTFSQAAESHTTKVFSGVVSNSTTNQPLVVAVIEETPATMSAYTGFGGGATLPVMPLVNIQPGKHIITGITIQNTGGSASNVTVSYVPDPGLGLGSACAETRSVPAGGNAVFALAAFANGANSNCAAGSTFVGSASVTSNSASMPLAVIVNQAVPGVNDGAFAGFNPAAATNKVVMPLIMDRNGSNKVFTSFSLVNVGSASTSVSCSFTGTSYTADTPVTLAPGAGFTKIQNGAVQSNYVGAGTCTATNSTDKIVAIVNQLSTVAAGDQLLVYNAINQ